MKKILLTISGLQFHKNEGAKNRLYSFIDSYSKNGYEVYVLLFFSLASFKYIFNNSEYLDGKAKWILFPSLPISYNKVIAHVSIFLNQIVMSIVSRLRAYSIIQAEVTGVTGKWVPRESLFITDFHGDSVSETVFRNNGKPNWLSKLIKQSQVKSLLYSRHIITVSENLRKRLEENTGVEIKNYSIVSCGVDTARFVHAKIYESNTEKIVIGYIGGLQKWQNIEVILDITLRLMNLDNRIYLKLFTNSDISNYISLLKQIGESNYEIKPLSFDEVPKHLKTLDAGFLIRDNIPLNIVSSPTKIAEYLAAGVPVICTKYSGDYKRSIEHEKQGFILNTKHLHDDVQKLHDYLCQVKNNREEYRQLCVAAAKEKDWDREFYQFTQQLNNIING